MERHKHIDKFYVVFARSGATWQSMQLHKRIDGTPATPMVRHTRWRGLAKTPPRHCERTQCAWQSIRTQISKV